MPLSRQRLLIALCYIFIWQVFTSNIYSQSKFNSDSLLTIIRTTPDEETKLNTLLLYSEEFKYTFPDSCMKYASAYFKEHNGKITKQNAQLKRLLGDVYWHLGNFDEALNTYSITYEFHKGIKNSKDMSQALGDMGYIKMEQGKYPESLLLYKDALQLARSIHDTEYISIVGVYIAQLYDWIGDHKESLKMYHEMRAIFENGKSKRSYGVVLMNIGAIHGLKKLNDSALIYYNKALEALPIEEEKSRAVIKLNMAHEYLLKHEALSKSRKLIDEAIPVFIKYKSQSNLALSDYYEGVYYLTSGDYNKSKKHLQKAITHYQSENNFSRLSMLYEKLAVVYEKLHQTDSAYAAFKLYKQHNDSLLTGLAANNMSYQKVMFDTDKKQLEIEALEQKQLTQNAQLERERIQRYAMYGGITLLLVFAAFIFNRFKVTQKQKKIIEIKEQETQQKNEIISYQKHIVEEKQKEILDSINYAKRIQHTLLAHESFLTENLPQHFVCFNPKDIVSGDFYWANKKDNRFYLAVCDSTGHGVPGAFMSLLNISFLNEAVNEKGLERPNEIFDFVRKRLIDNISKDGQKDGFDGILLCIDQQSQQITYAAAHNAPLLISNNQLLELGKNKMPVGIGDHTVPFELFTINAKKGDQVYLYTDGYADQFGGAKGKKFKYKQLEDLLLANHAEPLVKQMEILNQTFEKWKGNLEQVDDVCIIGLKI